MIFLLFLALFIFSNSNTNAQINRPFNNCYQDVFQGCDSCTDSSLVTKTFPYMGCNVEVTYKMRHCNCPDPTTFVDLEFLRVSLTDCYNLVCWLHPGPDPCINNPLNIDNYKLLEWAMYHALLDDLFNTDYPNYICPNTIKYKYYFPGQCNHICYYQVTGTNGGGVLYMTEECPGSIGCCGMEFTYCKQENGPIIKYWDSFNEPSTCSETIIPYPTCYYNVNDPITIGGNTWYVTLVFTTACIPDCKEVHGSNQEF